MPVDPPAVLRWRRAGQHRSRTLADLLAGIRAIVAYPDEYLDGLVEQMSEANVAHIPVISREDGRLLGYIGWKDLRNVRFRLQAEERERVVLYRVR